MGRRVVVTGLGAVSPLGNTAKDLWEGAKAGKRGIRPLADLDMSEQKVFFAGQAVDYKDEDYFDKKAARRMDRVTKFGIVAAREAVKDAGLDLESLDKDRCGVIVSSGIGGLETIEREETNGITKGFGRISPFFIPMAITNITAGSIAIEFGFNGSCHCVVSACASATDSIGEAFKRIRDGYQDVMIAGGAEASVTKLGLAGFASMKALSFSEDVERASIPFDKERGGFVMGEGSGILILEEYEHAVKRGAKIYAEIAGYGSTCDAGHITAPDAEGRWAAKCMEMAVADAGVKKEDVNYVNAHGTSTPLNDMCETRAIKKCFGDHAYNLKVSSTKSMVGHLLGASGGVEAIVTVMSVSENFITPTIGYKEKDEDCDLDIVPNVGVEAEVNCAISNSFGFGGHNATILFKKV